MEEIWRTSDRRGREVVLTSAYRDHILQEHDEMIDRLDEVRTAVEQPDIVTRDVKYRHRENHYRREPSGQGWLKVVVHYRPVPPQGTWAGEVITADPVKRPNSKEAQLQP
jgi:hypothetical protein